MTFTVEAALDDHVAALEIPRLPDGKWHPSSIFGCDRKAIYEVRGTTPTNPPNAGSRRTFRIGHIFHSFLQDAVAAKVGTAILRAYAEVPVNLPRLNITGHADGLVEHDNGAWELLEYKTTKEAGMARGLPKDDHVWQAFSYMAALREAGSPEHGIPPLGDSLSRARIAYIAKETMRVSESLIFWSQDRQDELEATVARLDTYRADGVALPPRLPISGGRKHWLCSYCSFATRCWEADKE